MDDCMICMSAGSINRWGSCDVCGEEPEQPTTAIAWGFHPAVSNNASLKVIEGGAGTTAAVDLDSREIDHATAS